MNIDVCGLEREISLPFEECSLGGSFTLSYEDNLFFDK